VPIKLSPTAPELFALFIYLIEVLIQLVKRVWAGDGHPMVAGSKIRAAGRPLVDLACSLV
jgi:hypothetical protein